MNGTVSERQLEEASSGTWEFDANGIVIHFSSNGSNTDLRISINNVTLDSPDEAPLFVWEWDMVFGAGAQPDCVITSSADAVRVLWQFHCDPEDRIARPASTASSTAAPTNALAWAWSWLRPQLAGWDWERNDLVLLLACAPPAPSCSLPLALARADRGLDRPHRQRGSLDERRRCRRTAERGRRHSHRLRGKHDRADPDPVRWRSDGSAGSACTQFMTAQAAAGLADVRNVAVGAGQQARQANRAVSEATTAAEAKIVQLLATQSGQDSFQTQAALQTASTSQKIHSGSNSTVAYSSNWDVSLGGTSTQASTSSATATGALTASSWQVIEQEQHGNSSDQLQIAGQLADTVQDMEILAAAGVADARISSRLNRDAASLGVSLAAAGSGSSRSEVNQLSLHSERRRGRRAQESYQTVSVTQTGSALGAASAGGTLRYFFIPPGPTLCQQSRRPPVETSLAAMTPTSAEPSFVPVRGIRPAFKTRKLAPSALPAVLDAAAPDPDLLPRAGCSSGGAVRRLPPSLIPCPGQVPPARPRSGPRDGYRTGIGPLSARPTA